MELEQLEIMVSLLLGTLEEEIRQRADGLAKLIKSDAPEEVLMNAQLELAELVHYFSTTGLLEALRVRWPAMNELFDRLLKLRQAKKTTEELDYLRKNSNG
jgi:hypothetical protein